MRPADEDRVLLMAGRTTRYAIEPRGEYVFGVDGQPIRSRRAGRSPHRSARRLLECGQTIAATAVATGFTDQSHLHRHFQRSVGLTPGEYRRRFEP